MAHTTRAGVDRLPNDPELELAFLGSCLLYWPRLGLGDGLDVELFLTEAHRRIAAAINRALLEQGELTPELVCSYSKQDAGEVTAALEAAPSGPRQALADLGRLGEIAIDRAEALALNARLITLVPPPAAGQGTTRGPGKDGTSWGESPPRRPTETQKHRNPEDDGELPFEFDVVSRRHNGTSLYGVKIGDELREVSVRDLLGDGLTAWAPFSGARGYARRQDRERLANAVISRGAAVPLELVEHLEGAGELAAGADRAGWEAIALELERAPKAALYVGGALASWFLKVAGMAHRLRPLGFILHAWGDPGSGKDTVAEVAAAVMGNPDRWPAGLVNTFGGTGNGLRLLADKAGRYPVIVTEVGIFNGKRSELQRALWSMVEGARPVSSRSGELLARSLTYYGVALTCGNETICDGGEPALRRRVLELAGPLTVDEQHADKLRELAFAHYGWPLAQIRGGALDDDGFALAVDYFAARLVGDEDNVTVRDAARRCAVLVAGAGALGALISDGHADELAAAAELGALAVLEDLRQSLEDGGANAGLAFLQTAWDDRSVRLIDYPEVGEPADFMARVRGYYHADHDRLSLRPAVARELAAAGGWSLELVVRQLRALGLLVHRRGMLRNVVSRREGPGLIRRYSVYTFNALPGQPDDDDEGEQSAGEPPAAPRSGAEPSTPAQSSRSQPRAGSEDAARGSRAGGPARGLGTARSQNAAARGSRGSSPTVCVRAGARGPLVLGARGLVGPGGLLPENCPPTLETVAAEAVGRGARVVLVHPEAELAGASLFVDVGDVMFVTLAHDRGGVCSPFTEAPGALELAEALEVFEREVGYPWHSSVGATVERLIMATHDPAKGGVRLQHNYDVPPPARENGLEGPTLWRRPLSVDEAAAGWVHGFDLHSQYLAAWGNVYLPFGAPELVKAPTFDPKREALWRLTLPGELGHLLPAPWGRGEWYSTPTLERAAELLPGPLEPLEAWVWPERRRYLFGAYERLRDARATLAADPSPAGRMALDAVKMCYRVGTGRFSYGGRAKSGSRWDRPEWGHWVRAKARVNQDRQLRKLAAPPFAILTDGLWFASSSPDSSAFANEIGLPLGEGLGGYSPTVTAELTPALAAALNAAKSPRGVVKALEQ